jgi:hypothetical protein
MNSSQGQGSTKAEKPPLMMPNLSQLFKNFSSSYSAFNVPQIYIDLDAGKTDIKG